MCFVVAERKFVCFGTIAERTLHCMKQHKFCLAHYTHYFTQVHADTATPAITIINKNATMKAISWTYINMPAESKRSACRARCAHTHTHIHLSALSMFLLLVTFSMTKPANDTQTHARPPTQKTTVNIHVRTYTIYITPWTVNYTLI